MSINVLLTLVEQYKEAAQLIEAAQSLDIGDEQGDVLEIGRSKSSSVEMSRTSASFKIVFDGGILRSASQSLIDDWATPILIDNIFWEMLRCSRKKRRFEPNDNGITSFNKSISLTEKKEKRKAEMFSKSVDISQ